MELVSDERQVGLGLHHQGEDNRSEEKEARRKLGSYLDKRGLCGESTG